MAGGLSTSDAPLGLGGAAGGAASPLYYPAVALAALTRVLREPSLVAQHRATVPPIVTVLSELGTRATPLLPDVMPLLLAAASGPDPLLVEAVVRELGALVPALGLLSRPYVPPLLELVLAHLPGPHASIQAHCICLVEALCEALRAELTPHLEALLPRMLSILRTDRSDTRMPTLRVLHALGAMATSLGDAAPPVVGELLWLAQQRDAPMRPRRRAIKLLRLLFARLPLREHAAHTAHVMLALLGAADDAAELRQPALHCLHSLSDSLGDSMLSLSPNLASAVAAASASSPRATLSPGLGPHRAVGRLGALGASCRPSPLISRRSAPDDDSPLLEPAAPPRLDLTRGSAGRLDRLVDRSDSAVALPALGASPTASLDAGSFALPPAAPSVGTMAAAAAAATAALDGAEAGCEDGAGGSSTAAPAVDAAALATAWAGAAERATRDEWSEWLRRLALEQLRAPLFIDRCDDSLPST